jgi:hypothetical protein
MDIKFQIGEKLFSYFLKTSGNVYINMYHLM